MMTKDEAQELVREWFTGINNGTLIDGYGVSISAEEIEPGKYVVVFHFDDDFDDDIVCENEDDFLDMADCYREEIDPDDDDDYYFDEPYYDEDYDYYDYD